MFSSTFTENVYVSTEVKPMTLFLLMLYLRGLLDIQAADPIGGMQTAHSCDWIGIAEKCEEEVTEKPEMMPINSKLIWSFSA